MALVDTSGQRFRISTVNALTPIDSQSLSRSTKHSAFRKSALPLSHNHAPSWINLRYIPSQQPACKAKGGRGLKPLVLKVEPNSSRFYKHNSGAMTKQVAQKQLEVKALELKDVIGGLKTELALLKIELTKQTAR